MVWLNEHLLSFLIFFPVAWAIFGLILPYNRAWTLLGSLITFGVSVLLYGRYDAAGAEFQLAEHSVWIPYFGVTYSLGMDGISLWLALLTTFLTPLVVLSSFQAIGERQKQYYFLLLALEGAMLGAFFALDIFLFYVFWEAMLIPMYFLIGIWGGNQRTYAAMKFFLFTVTGSLLMLVAIFYLIHQHMIQFGNYSCAITDLYRLRLTSGGFLMEQSLLFLAFALAFAIKVPLFPLHTWLPDAHVQAPTGGSVILAGVMLKMGGYGFVRFAFPMFPQAVAEYQYLFLFLGSVAIVYGAWVAMVQPDIKKLVAYSSVSHMGYVMMGLFSLTAIGATGSVYQMLNHGVSTGGLFLLVGMIYERRHTREISEFGGIARVMPLYTVAFMIITLSSIALPGTNGFVGEFLILQGAWLANRSLTVLAATGVIFGAVYMLWMVQRVMYGKITRPENEKLKDLSFREVMVLVPLIVVILVMGVFPNFFFRKMDSSVQRLLTRATAASINSTSASAVPAFESHCKELTCNPS